MKTFFFSLLILFTSVSFFSEAQQVYYVNPSATGLDNGSSWTNAFTDLQTALNAKSTTVVDTIKIANTTITLQAALPNISKNVVIKGGYDPISSLQTGYTTIDGDGKYSVFSTSGISPNTIFDHLIIQNGHSVNGAGMFCNKCSPTLTNVIFRNNTATNSGGAMFSIATCFPILTNVIFTGNTANLGGAMYNQGKASPIITNAIFSKNISATNGGAIVNNEICKPTLTNVVFVANESKNVGGAVSNQKNSYPKFCNVTFVLNKTINSGGAVYDGLSNIDYYLYAGKTIFENTVFYDNSANSNSDLYYTTGTCYGVSISKCASDGTYATAANWVNLTSYTDASEIFVDINNVMGTDGVWPTSDDGLVPNCNGPLYNAGKNNSITTDLAGNTRIYNDTIDIGAYESQKKPGFIEKYTLTYDLNGGVGIAPTDTNSPYELGTFVTVLDTLTGTSKANAMFVGWTTTLYPSSITNPTDTVGYGSYNPGTTFVMPTQNTTLYAVWAYDKNGNGIADYVPSLTILPENKWPETDPDKPKWNSQYDDDNAASWNCGCDMILTMTVCPDPQSERTIKFNYLGTLKKGFVVDEDGEVLADSYTLAKGDSVFTLHISILEDSITSANEGQTGAVETAIVGGGRDTSEWFTLYSHPSYDDVFVKPLIRSDKTVDFGITGGTPNLMRSINGGPWRNAYSALTSAEQLSVIDGASIWLREPNGCWEAEFFFITYTDPTVLRYVDIPSLAGVTTAPGAGKHYVEGHQDFTFTASYAGGSPLKVMAKGYYTGTYEELIGQNMDDGTYKYIISKVTEPWDVTFGPDLASGTVDNELTDNANVWSFNNVLHIHSNVNATAYIYNISGTLYKRLTLTEGDTHEEMMRGVYVVVVGNSRYKVIIK